MKELKRLLKPLKNKIVINNLILRLMQTLAAGIAIDFIILVVSKFAHIPNRNLICLAITTVSVAVGLILALIKYKVTYYNAAEEGDKLGCNERLITAYGILKKGGEYSPMEGLVIKDAVETAKKTKLSDSYKIKFPKRIALVLCVILAASCLTGFAPDAGVYVPTVVTENALKETEEIKKSVNKDDQLSESFKEQYNEILKNLNKELKKAKDAKEAKKLINDAQKELKKLENKSEQDKNNIKNALSDYSAGKDISSAMDLNDSEALSKAMAQLAEELKNMTDEQLAELAAQLSEIADQMTDEELQKLLEEASEAAENGDTDKLSEALSQAASSSLSKYSAASSASNRTASSLAKASDGTGKTATSASNNSGSSTTQGNGSQNGSSDGNGSGSGDGDGQGSGQGNGQGSGQGSGNGSGNGSGGSGSGSGGDGRGSGHTEPEKIYTMTASGLNGEEEQLQSQQTDDGEVTYSETKSDGVNGQSVPYSAVVGEYKQQALKETENGNIPYGMKTIIAEYFSGLEK